MFQKAKVRKTFRTVLKNRATAVLLSFVLLIAALAPVLPTVAQSDEPMCGLEEHIHNQECYETRTIPVLSDDGEVIGEDVETVLVCNITEHQHGPDCYSEEQEASGPAEDAAEVSEKTVFTGEDKGITVTVTADPDVFPEGTTMTVTAIDAEELPGDIPGQEREEASVAAVDICFLDSLGNEIEPSGPVEVSIKSDNVSDSGTSVLHMDDDGNVTEIDETAVESDTVSFEAGGFSIYIILGSTIEKNILASDGSSYKVTVKYGDDACIPDGAGLEVDEIAQELDSYVSYVSRAEDALNGSAEYIRLFDIKIVDENGGKVQPAEGSSVEVSIELADSDLDSFSVVHFPDEGQEAQVVEQVETSAGSVSFETDGFSVYAVVYTVDFSYSVDGETFELSIPGGGFISLTDLVKKLGLAVVNGEEEAERFVSDIESAEFSGSGLVWVGRAETDTTVSGIKTANALECRYSAELTEEQIAEINAQPVRKGDWVIISLKPFETRETLTVTMKNGDRWTVGVTDFMEINDPGRQSISSSSSYIIASVDPDGTYHVLKNDGTAETFPASKNLDALDSTYRWMFTYVFEEKDRTETIEYIYYMIRPQSSIGSTIALNVPDDPAGLVQPSNNNIAVIPQDEGGFILRGYNNVALSYGNGGFSGMIGEGTVIHLFEMETLSKYEYTVRSADESMGYVTVSDGTADTSSGTTVYSAETTASESSSGKYNAGRITATPVDHRNGGQNKWLFDHWELNGKRLENVPATIAPGTIEIPYNASELVAHFRLNPAYVFPDSEKQGSSFEDMSEWLQRIQETELPLDRKGCKKTAEVVDYENRIYRVDLTSKASLTTFDGSIDMGFILDVSNSMKFPSDLQPIPGMSNIDIRNINEWNYFYRRPNYQVWGMDTSQTYYIISDPNHTSTVYKIQYIYGDWEYKDASKDDSAYETIDEDTVFKANQGNNYDNNYRYQIYYDADPEHNRFYYLNQSISSTTTALTDILNKLKIASTGNPHVRIAYNTFNKYLNGTSSDNNTKPNSAQDFRDVYPLNVDFSYTAGGGTRPDRGLWDASTHWSWSAPQGSRYAILITDGAPQGARGGENNPTTEQIIANNVIPETERLKSMGVKLITIGLSMENVDRGRILLYDLADTVNGKKMFFSAEKGSDLTDILLQIVSTIMQDAIVVGDVTDKIGDAFYPVDRSTGEPLMPGDKVDLLGNVLPRNYSGSEPYGVIQPDGRTIVWQNQYFTHDGWHGTVYVKAMEDFLGGNAVRTNTGNAMIEAIGYKLSADGQMRNFGNYPQKLTSRIIDDLVSPRVNVNELTFNKNSTEWTVYLGTEVDPLEQLRKLWNGISVEETVKKGRAADTDRDGLPDTGIAGTDSYLWYDYQPGSIDDDRENSGRGDKLTFSMNDLIRMLAENREKTYSWWDYSKHEPKWEQFLEAAASTGGIVIDYDEYGPENVDSSNIKITMEKIITAGEEDDLSNSPHRTNVVNKEGTDGDGNAVDIPVEKYKLTVLYSPDYEVVPVGQGGSGSNEYHTGTFGTMYQGHAAGTETSENEHVINVYAEPLDILKIDDHGSPVSGVQFKLYREARNGETGTEKLAAYDLSLDGDYYCISAASSGEDGTVHLAPDDEDHTVPVSNSKGHTAKDLLETGETYYLIEVSTPDGYKKDQTVRSVTAMAGPDFFTKAEGETAAVPDPATGKPAEAYNWEQGVTVTVRILGAEEGNEAQLVAHDTGEHVTLYDEAGRERTYMLRSDSGSLAVTRVTIVNSLSTDILIKKTDMDGNGLAGAVFRMVKVDATGREHDLERQDGLSDVTKTVGGQQKTFTSAFETNGGEQLFRDLADGTYRLYEVFVPDGYLRTFNYVEFTIEGHVITELKTDTDETNKVSSGVSAGSAAALITIKNEQGVPFPSTGGRGTRVSSVIGYMLLLSGAVWLLRKKIS